MNSKGNKVYWHRKGNIDLRKNLTHQREISWHLLPIPYPVPLDCPFLLDKTNPLLSVLTNVHSHLRKGVLIMVRYFSEDSEICNFVVCILFHNTSILTTFEWCFLISKYHENCNVMSSFTVLCHVPWNTYFQYSAMFSLVCYGFYLLFTYYVFVVIQQVTNTAYWNSGRMFNFWE